MANEIKIQAEPRATRGKNEARRLRVKGRVPAVVYGAGKDAVAVAVDPKEITRMLHSATGHNTIFQVEIGSLETAPVMVVDWQRDPIKDNLLHCDLLRIDMTKRIVVKIPVRTAGEPRGVKEQGGLHEVVSREVEIECLPSEIPDGFTLDVRGLMLGQSIRVSEIPLTGSMKLVTPGENLVSHVVAVRAEAEPAAEAEGAAATTAEPEVIKKGKKEEEAAADEKKKK
jgi:large subunit ribosomal protein L25